MPPPEIRYRIVNMDHSEEEFLRMAAQCQAAIQLGLTQIGRKLGDFESVLDWGAGCGRIMRGWLDLFDSVRFCGSDIDSVMIEWDKQHLPGVEWQTNAADPPLPWPDHTFDLIYGASVFTHLDRERQARWSSELVRVSRPDGIVMLSTHGSYSFDASLREGATPEQIRAFDGEGFLHIKNIADGVLPDWYQTTFQRFEQLKRDAPAGLVPIDHIPGSAQGRQDLTMFRVEG